MIQIPELGLNFDMESCPRWALASGVHIPHGHMDPLVVSVLLQPASFSRDGGWHGCLSPSLVIPLRDMMKSWIVLEQRTPFELVGLAPGEEWELKPDVFLRPFETSHTVPSQRVLRREKKEVEA